VSTSGTSTDAGRMVRPRSRLRLRVDWTACDGRGLCAELLPELLVQDEWGYPLARGENGEVAVPGPLAGPARRAVAACPRLALHLRED